MCYMSNEIRIAVFEHETAKLKKISVKYRFVGKTVSAQRYQTTGTLATA
jgi:hypothetical protein